jgi:hypothetical protein
MILDAKIPKEKIKTLKGFLEGRVRAAALEKVADLKHGFPDKWQAVAEVTCMRNSR